MLVIFISCHSNRSDVFKKEVMSEIIKKFGRGKYGLRPDQLKFGDDKQILLTTDSNVESYLLITEVRRNN